MGTEEMDDEQEKNPFRDAMALAASSNPDIMYVDEALRAPDRDQFIKAMEQEIASHTDNNHWEIVNRSEVPNGIKVLPSVWAMRRKRRLDTLEVYKWKARLNVHGGKQQKEFRRRLPVQLQGALRQQYTPRWHRPPHSRQQQRETQQRHQ